MTSSGDERKHARPIGLLGATSAVVASMIGVGIFTSPGYTIDSLGSARIAFFAWLIGGEIAICGAVAYGALAKRFAESGGEYLYLARAVHPWAGFVAGWTSLFAGFAGPTAAAAIAFSQYFPETDPANASYISLSLIALATCLHFFSTVWGTWSQTMLVLSKILFLSFAGTAITWFAITSDSSLANAASTGFLPASLGKFAISLMWIGFAYTGFNAAIYFAGEVREPLKTVPTAMLIGTVITVMLYLCLIAALYACSPEWLTPSAIEKPFHALSLDMFGMDGIRVANCIVGLCLLTSVSSLTQTGPRVLSKMADDGVVPSFLRARSGCPPRAAIIVQSLIAAVIVTAVTLQELLTYLGMTLSLCSAASVATLFFRKRGSDLNSVQEMHAPETVPTTPVPYRRQRVHPAVHLAAAIYIFATVAFAGIAILYEPWSVAGTAVVLVSATTVYWLMRFIPKPGTGHLGSETSPEI